MDSVERAQGNALYQELIEVVNECQQQFEGKKEIATESNSTVKRLCSTWESVLCFGIKSTKSKIFETIDIIGKQNEFPLWDFCQSHMTKDERERFDSLKNVSTKRYKLNALIRSSLNERSLERYLSMWLGDIRIKDIYEPWAVMLSTDESRNLPALAKKLSNILFAIQVDNAEVVYEPSTKKEPLIFVPPPIGPKKRMNPIKRRILTSPDDTSSIKVENEPVKEEKFQDIQECVVEAKCEELAEICFDTSNIKLAHSEDIKIISDEPQLSPEHIEAVTLCKPEKQNNLSEQDDAVVNNFVDLNLNHQESHECCESTENKNYFTVTIPRVILKNSKRKKFHVYEVKIEFKLNNDSLVIERRYSEFLQLHESIKRKNDVVKLLDFPPKKFGNMSVTFIEERRQRLQIYLNNLLRILPETMYCRRKKDMQLALDFLKL